MDNEKVKFYWTIVGVDFEEDNEAVYSELLRRIVELFVTIRGFSYASAWLRSTSRELKSAPKNLRAFVRI